MFLAYKIDIAICLLRETKIDSEKEDKFILETPENVTNEKDLYSNGFQIKHRHTT
jgi:hypothetical protein